VPDHSGSGVIISKGGFVLTKAHVIENNLTGLIIVRRETLSGPESAHFAKLASIDYERDLALLWVPTHFPVIARLGGSTNLRPGSPVYTVSTPAGLETNIFSAGYFRARTRDLTDLQDDLLLDLATIPGSSGGGIYDRNGDLIGLDDALLKSGDGTVWPNFSYGTSVEQVRIFLKASFDFLDPASPCVPPLINPPPASAVEAPSAPSCR